MGTEKNSGRGTEGSEINSEDYESATTFSPNVFLNLNFIKLRTFCSQKGGGGTSDADFEEKNLLSKCGKSKNKSINYLEFYFKKQIHKVTAS